MLYVRTFIYDALEYVRFSSTRRREQMGVRPDVRNNQINKK